jgi:hypothetical protein
VVPFESLFILNAGEKIQTLQDVAISTSGMRLPGKLALTNERLSLFIKNPISGSYTASEGISKSSVQNLKFGNDATGPFLERNALKVYFQNNVACEDFRRRLNPLQSPLQASEKTFNCSVCGKVISKEAIEGYDGKCWECWDDEFTEESDTMFGEPI